MGTQAIVSQPAGISRKGFTVSYSIAADTLPGNPLKLSMLDCEIRRRRHLDGVNVKGDYQ